MAAKPDKKRWWGERPLPNTIVGAVLGAVLAAGLAVVVPRCSATTNTPPQPTSDRAAIAVDWPCLPHDRKIQVSGSGWLGDTEVEVNFPEQLHYSKQRTLVDGGHFSSRRLEIRPEDWQPLDIFVVTVRGLQSRKQLKEELYTASGAGSCSPD